MIDLDDRSTGSARGGLAAEMAELFSERGALSSSPDFEFRPEQQEMAVRVAAALAEERPLVIEAGTGVGKSLAYLLPAIRYALMNKRKALISTHTINLQEQLVRKDLPLAGRVLRREFSYLLWKGRANYLCPQRLRAAMAQPGELFSGDEEAELRAIWEWAQRTEDGSLSDLDFRPAARVWAQVCSEAGLCTPRRCGKRPCFYQALRRRLEEADVVVLNHTLFFALLAAQEDDLDPRGEGLLFAKDFVVFDEAHTLENIAARQLGLHVSPAGAALELHRLYHPKHRKGLFQALRHSRGIRAVEGVLDDLQVFFGEVENACRFRGENRTHRVREPALVENSLSEGLVEVERSLASAAEGLEDEDFRLELDEMGRRVRSLRSAVTDFLEQRLEDHVYWVEKQGAAGKVSLEGAPLDVAGRLHSLLFARPRPVILTSATLAVGDPGLAYFRKRVGAEAVEAVSIGSPFDYTRQMKLYVVASMPDPDGPGYEDALAHWIEHFLRLSEGRAFVLFTSHRLMRAMAERLRRFCQEAGWPLLVQGEGQPRHRLIEAFRREVSSVLFGTDSFWTGVDVPGEALSNVIVTRLPFAVPDHPLTASRIERIQEDGGDPFLHYSLPEAILKLRQGIGRLIRSQKDRGIAVILDKRIVTRAYGKRFLKSLPPAPLETVGAPEGRAEGGR